MTKREIITEMARTQEVERLVQAITRRPLDATTRDLAQMVYVYLLEFPEERLLDLYQCRQLHYFTGRIIAQQWYGKRSTFNHALRVFSARSVDTARLLGDHDREGEAGTP